MLDGRPERLLIEREGDMTPRLGARYLGRVSALSRRMDLARIDIGFGVGAGQAATLKLGGTERLSQGSTVEVEVATEPTRGKGAGVKLLRIAESAPPQCVAAPTPMLDRLHRWAPETAVVTGADARAFADEAQTEALAREHRLPGGVTLTIEPTRALTAVDVDLSEPGSPKAALQANLQALSHASRLLRLKSLGGLIAIDLVGFPKEKLRLQEAARAAFALDGSEVTTAPISRFGVLELAKPRREQPVEERLLDTDGRLSAKSIAQQLVRDLQRQAGFAPGMRLTAICSADVARELAPLVAKLGPQFSLQEGAGRDRAAFDITAR